MEAGEGRIEVVSRPQILNAKAQIRTNCGKPLRAGRKDAKRSSVRSGLFVESTHPSVSSPVGAAYSSPRPSPRGLRFRLNMPLLTELKHLVVLGSTKMTPLTGLAQIRMDVVNIIEEV